MCFAITAMAVDATCDVSTANATRALRTIQGIEEGSSFFVTPFYPEPFLVQCRSQAVRD